MPSAFLPVFVSADYVKIVLEIDSAHDIVVRNISKDVATEAISVLTSSNYHVP
jgi:hypothetical protein